MSVLKLLHIHLDLENRSVRDLTEQEVIRIEKKLKAEVRLNQKLNLNEVETILRIIREHKQELTRLYHPWFKTLRDILMNPQSFTVSARTEPYDLAVDEKLEDFFSAFFNETLVEYASLCIQQDHYNALNALVLYKDILPSGLLDDVREKCVRKIEYGTECINLDVQNLETKIACLTNPFFYRTLNKLGSGGFENCLIDLLNAGIEHLQKPKRKLFMHFLYAAGFFVAVRSDLRTVFESNQQLAVRYGIREKVYSAFEKDQKGGTVHLSEKASVISSGVESKGKNGAGCGVAGGGFVIVLIILKILLFGGRALKDEVKFEYPVDYYDPVNYEMDYTDQILQQPDSGGICYLNELAFYLQSDEPNILQETDIDFAIEETNLNPVVKLFEFKEIDFVNKTSQPVIILTSGLSGIEAVFVDSGETGKSSVLNKKFVIYTGIGPQRIRYLDENDIPKEGFRFRYFSASDSEIL